VEVLLRKLVLQMQYSVDGFFAGPSNELDWIFSNFDDAVTAWIVGHLWKAGVHIMGSRTFHDMAAYWPTSTEPYAGAMNEIPKVAFSKRGLDLEKPQVTQAIRDAAEARRRKGVSPASSAPPSAVSWKEAVVARGDLGEEINRLKAQPGKEILAHGGAGFAQSLVRTGLIDEYRLITHPIVLGKGKSLFDDVSRPIKLKLVGNQSFDTGVVAHIYQPA
jgi:dihydrofolate reductase